MQSSTLSLERTTAEDFVADTLILPIPGDRLSESEALSEFYGTAGESVLSAVREDLPLRPGNVAVTDGGNLDYERIVHIPVQSAPSVPTTEENLQVGLRSGLVAADEEGTRTVALADLIPADQTEEMDHESVAETILQDLLQYPPAHFSEVTIVSENRKWIEALREQQEF